MKKLKILIINDYGFLFGGTETMVLSQKRELIRRGHVVRIFSRNLDYYRGEHFGDYRFSGFNESSTIKWLNQIFNPKSYFKLKEILKEFKPDIVHLHNIFYQVSPSVLKCLKNTPTIMTINSYEMICPMGTISDLNVICNYKFGKQCLKCIGSFRGYYYEKVKQKIHKMLLNNVDVFIAPSKDTKKNFENQDFINREVINIYNGIKLLKYYEIKNTKKILYIGRLSKEKGVEYLLNAIPLILKKYPKVRCDIVGDGPDKERLEKLVKKLGLSKNIKFHGKISYEKVEECYRRSTVVVVPSICTDTLPTVCIEAMSVGRPVIGSNIGGIPELINNGKTGYLIKPRVEKQITEKVIKLFENRKLLKMMGKEARIRSYQFSIEKYINNLERLYEKILKKYIKI